MRRLTAGLSLCLLATTAPLVLAAAEAQSANGPVNPDRARILWNDEARLDPIFFPWRLLDDRDLTSPETADLSDLPMTEEQIDFLRIFLAVQPREPGGCVHPPFVVFACGRGGGLPRSWGLAQMLRRYRLVATGVVREIVPGWSPGEAIPLDLIFFEVSEVLRDIDGVATPGQALVYLEQPSDEPGIGGRRICPRQTDEIQPEKGTHFLAFGYGYSQGGDDDRISVTLFEIRDSFLFPNPLHMSLKASESGPIPLWVLREQMEHLEALNP